MFYNNYIIINASCVVKFRKDLGQMTDKNNISYMNNIEGTATESTQSSNPLSSFANKSALSDYTQIVSRKNFDEDAHKIAEVVRILNNLAPLTMPVYNFNIDEINGERYYKPDGSLLLVRDFDSDVIRDYYYNPNADSAEYTVSRLLEHDKNTGRLRVKIEPITRKGSRLKTTIAIFDEKINNKYTIIQLSDNGIVNNISEFSGKGKSFQTLFRSSTSFKPVRYIEGKDNKDSGFEMVDCLFSESGEIVRIKKYNSKKEINIDYTDSQKHVSVKTK